MFDTARWRLALWFAGVFAVLLVVIGGAVFFTTRAALFDQVDSDLEVRSNRLVREFRGPGGGLVIPRRDVIASLTAGGYFFVVNGPGGTFSASESAAVISLPPREELATETTHGTAHIETDTDEGERLRVRIEPIGDAQERVYYVMVGRSIQPELDALRRLAFVLIGGGAVGLFLAGGAGYWLAGRALRPIQSAMDAQRTFVADASHEIRTPLTLIRANAEVLKRDTTAPSDRTLVDDIIRESDRLSYLVGQMLTIARADSAGVELEATPVHLGRLAEDIARQMQLLANEKKITVQVNAANDAIAEGDEQRLGELLIILIDNAIKYSGEGATVSVDVARQGNRVHLTVSDTGPGIPADALPHVFDRFYRADKARSREQGGTGLGLAIAHWIVERHNGHIAIRSTVGAGTEVSVDLPSLSAYEPIEDVVFQNPATSETVETAKRTSEQEGPASL